MHVYIIAYNCADIIVRETRMKEASLLMVIRESKENELFLMRLRVPVIELRE